MDKDRPEPLIFEAWLSALRRIMINEKTGLPLTKKGPYAATTLFSLITEHPQWCDAPQKPDPDCRQTIDARARRGARSAHAARRRRHEPMALGRANMSRC